MYLYTILCTTYIVVASRYICVKVRDTPSATKSRDQYAKVGAIVVTVLKYYTCVDFILFFSESPARCILYV